MTVAGRGAPACCAMSRSHAFRAGLHLDDVPKLRQPLAQRLDLRAGGGVGEEHGDPAVLKLESLLRPGELAVDPDPDGAEPLDGEVGDDDVRVVGGAGRDAVARADAERLQHGGARVDRRIQLGEAVAAVAADEGLLARPLGDRAVEAACDVAPAAGDGERGHHPASLAARSR